MKIDRIKPPATLVEGTHIVFRNGVCMRHEKDYTIEKEGDTVFLRWNQPLNPNESVCILQNGLYWAWLS